MKSKSIVKRLASVAAIVIFAFITGCSNTTGFSSDGTASAKSDTASAASTESSNAASYAVSAASVSPEHEQSNLLDSNAQISQAKAVSIALEEAKRWQSEYEFAIDGSAVDNATCEIRNKDGNIYYSVVFRNLKLTHGGEKSPYELKTAVGIDVDANSGEILEVHRFK